MTDKNDGTRSMLESLHAQMGEWVAELDHRADLDEGEAWLMLDVNEWREHIGESIAEQGDGENKLDYKDGICPMSGIGKPPSEWSKCTVQCFWYDATKGLCAVQALWHLRELPGIHADTSDAAAALLVM